MRSAIDASTAALPAVSASPSASASPASLSPVLRDRRGGGVGERKTILTVANYLID